jgi:DnaJ-domain-containing protein 1
MATVAFSEVAGGRRSEHERAYWRASEDETDWNDNDETDESQADDDSLQKQQRPWFEVLQVSPNASLDEIKGARNRLVRGYHSDRLRGIEGLSPDFVKFADGKLAEVNAAFAEAEAALRGRKLRS